ncbi:cupin domain-containing protein [Xanthomonas campestris pv. cannae]|nr:cupin domain-containing protein [Xanthomonas campestris pv. cannae]
MSTVNIASARHYVWGGNCDGWHLLDMADLSVIEERMPPGTAEARHRHLRARQFFRVLEGEAALEMEGVVHVLHAGDGLHVPPGAAHQLRNASNADVRFLVISAPHSHGDREPAALETPK